MTRRELRENTFKLLFSMDFHDRSEYEGLVSLYLENLENADDIDKEFINKRFFDVVERLDAIDAKIDESAIGWKTARMNKVDLTLLRLAVFEIVFDEDVPRNVAINECVELAKIFGTDNSPAFVNGVLSKIQ